jgi:hypothetical protein
MRRAHARRDRITLQAEQLRELLDGSGLASTAWDEADRKACEKVFNKARQGSLEAPDRAHLQAVIRRRIDGATGS